DSGKFGSCHDSKFGGDKLANTGKVVYIAANYRLGAFGFLAHPELSLADEAGMIVGGGGGAGAGGAVAGLQKA
ncbi:MAG: carboxylesterase family protein, partial [Brachymonas sp.]|nr:carboxylesterase family protein [Brachymonas sp.]